MSSFASFRSFISSSENFGVSFVSGVNRSLKRSDVSRALNEASIVFFCTAHRKYSDEIETIIRLGPKIEGVFDGCNLFSADRFSDAGIGYAGIGRGRNAPSEELIRFVCEGFTALERGFANEIQDFIDFANSRFAADDFNRLDYREVKRIAGTCVTGCRMLDPGRIKAIPAYNDFNPRLLSPLTYT